jgi:uncharacterized membrane protein
MSLYNWFVVVHVLAPMTWVGGGLMLSIIGWRARSTTNPNALSEFAQILSFVGLRDIHRHRRTRCPRALSE